MNCKEARTILLNPGRGKTATVRQEQAHKHVASCPTCQAGLTRLSVEIECDETICAEVQEMLPMYIEAEMDGKPVQEDYPPLWAHLTNCSLCAQVHAELRELLEFERQGQVITPSTYPAFSLPFIPAPSLAHRAVQWAVEMATDTLGHVSATITISKAYLVNALSPQPLLPAFRSSQSLSATPKRFPLMDIPLEEVSWLVSLEAMREEMPPPHPDRWHVQVSVTNLTPSGRIQVRISDGQEERTAMLDENGIAFFSDVPVNWLTDKETTAGNKLRVEIQHVE